MKFALPFVCALFFLWGCEAVDEPVSDTTQPQAETTAQPQQTHSSPQTPMETPSNNTTELQINTLREGTGSEVKNGDTVLVHYVGTFLDGKTFDSSRDRGQPFEVIVGNGQVIKGWDMGLAGMKTGELRKLLIPSDLAYGDNGFPPIIPPKTPLVFEVELMEIK